MVYVLVFLILLGIILNSLSKKYALKGIRYSREISKKIVEIDEDFEIVTVIENRKALPVTFFQIIERFPATIQYRFRTDRFKTTEFLYHTITMFLLPYQRIKRTYIAYCDKRGRYIFSDVSLIAGDLLGLNTFTRSLDYWQEIIALPRPADLREEIIPYGDYNGELSIERWIIDDPTMIIGVREYTGLEPAKTIHWPSSAKSNRLMVKKFDFTLENTAMVLLNIECVKPFWSGIDKKSIDSIERCISITRGIIETLEEKKIPYGFITNAIMSGLPAEKNIVYPSSGQTQLSNLLEYLGRMSYNISVSFEDLVLTLWKRDIRCSTHIIITPRVLDPYVELINSMASEMTRIILVSLSRDNLEYLSDNIIKYTGDRSNEYTLS
jgi:uncharacterized protein (DUF58 family)